VTSSTLFSDQKDAQRITALRSLHPEKPHHVLRHTGAGPIRLRNRHHGGNPPSEGDLNPVVVPFDADAHLGTTLPGQPFQHLLVLARSQDEAE